MKKVDVINLSASLCLLFGSVLHLINTICGIPLWLRIFSIPLLLTSIVLYAIVIRRQMKDKKKEDKKDEREN